MKQRGWAGGSPASKNDTTTGSFKGTSGDPPGQGSGPSRRTLCAPLPGTGTGLHTTALPSLKSPQTPRRRVVHIILKANLEMGRLPADSSSEVQRAGEASHGALIQSTNISQSWGSAWHRGFRHKQDLEATLKQSQGPEGDRAGPGSSAHQEEQPQPACFPPPATPTSFLPLHQLGTEIKREEAMCSKSPRSCGRQDSPGAPRMPLIPGPVVWRPLARTARCTQQARRAAARILCPLRQKRLEGGPGGPGRPKPAPPCPRGHGPAPSACGLHLSALLLTLVLGRKSRSKGGVGATPPPPVDSGLISFVLDAGRRQPRAHTGGCWAHDT